MQIMFNHIQNFNCGDSVYYKAKLGKLVELDEILENCVILGHIPKLLKIIDWRNVQVGVLQQFSQIQVNHLDGNSCVTTPE